MAKVTKDEMRMTNPTDYVPDPNYVSEDKEKEKLATNEGLLEKLKARIAEMEALRAGDEEEDA